MLVYPIVKLLMILLKSLLSDSANKSIFITGATGFFGRSLLDSIISQGIEFKKITILSRDPVFFFKCWPKYSKIKNLSFTKGDIQNFNFSNETYDYVLHFATPASASLNLENPLAMTDIIINGMLRILDFTVHCKAKKFLFTSSGAVYGTQPPEIIHISEAYTGAPIVHQKGAAYGEAKRLAELMGCEYARKYNFEFKIARCFAFCGPHLDQNGSFAIGNFIRDAKNKKNISISGDGTPCRSYLYSDDLICWLFKILIDGKNCEPYNVGSDQAISIIDLANKVIANIDTSLKATVALVPVTGKAAPRYVPSIEKAKKELGLAVWTDLDTAILKSKNIS